MGRVEELFHQGLAGMGERPVADVMEEPGRNHERTVFFGKPEAAGCHIRKEHSAKRMLEPRVISPRVYEIGKTELPDITESLEGEGIEQGKCKILDFNVTVDRVLDDLHRFTKESSYTWHKSIE
jgi:hypothetical protein